MTKRVWSGFGREADLFAEILQDALSFAYRQATVVFPDEERSDWRGGEAAFGVEGQKLGYAGASDIVERDDPGLTGFGEMGGQMEFFSWSAVIGDEVDGETTGFSYPEPRVEEEQDEEIISSPEGALEIDA